MNGDAATSAADLAFRARALAQAHPFSAAAYRIVNSAAAQESRVQNPAEAGVWAAAAFTQGYCLRRVQETAEDVDVPRNDEARRPADGSVLRGLDGGPCRAPVTGGDGQ